MTLRLIKKSYKRACDFLFDLYVIDFCILTSGAPSYPRYGGNSYGGYQPPTYGGYQKPQYGGYQKPQYGEFLNFDQVKSTQGFSKKLIIQTTKNFTCKSKTFKQI